MDLFSRTGIACLILMNYIHAVIVDFPKSIFFKTGVRCILQNYRPGFLFRLLKSFSKEGEYGWALLRSHIFLSGNYLPNTFRN
jgi:hypothetical protein